jgi:hypothetical protein
MREGWVCPKCGAPNNPDNKTCVACFAPTLPLSPTLPEHWPNIPPGITVPGPWVKPEWMTPKCDLLSKPLCPKCGKSGDYCTEFQCPMKVGIAQNTSGDENEV